MAAVLLLVTEPPVVVGGEGARAELRQRKGAAVGLDPTTFRHGASRPDQTDGDDR